MRTLFLLPLLIILVSPSQNPQTSDEGSSSVAVLNFKWVKSRQVVEKLETADSSAPASAMIPANKNFERNARAQAPAGLRDPNADTLDGRRAELDRIVQESRSAKPKPLDGLAYRIKVKNSGAKAVEVLFWEYQFIDTANPALVTRHQFLCAVNIKPDKEKEVLAFSASGPADVISVESLANKSGNAFQEKVVINRVEYSDGTIWQRKGWNFAEIGLSYKRAVATPWGLEMCRGL